MNPLRLDMNGDGVFTRADVWPLLLQLSFLPGDYSLWLCLTLAPDLARFLELSEADYQGLASGLVSAVFWLVALTFLGASHSVLRRVERTMTRAVARSWNECLRRGRVARIRLACRVRGIKMRLALRKRNSAPDIDLDEIARIRRSRDEAYGGNR